jgi:hypothetical protein
LRLSPSVMANCAQAFSADAAPIATVIKDLRGEFAFPPSASLAADQRLRSVALGRKGRLGRSADRTLIQVSERDRGAAQYAQAERNLSSGGSGPHRRDQKSTLLARDSSYSWWTSKPSICRMAPSGITTLPVGSIRFVPPGGVTLCCWACCLLYQPSPASPQPSAR